MQIFLVSTTKEEFDLEDVINIYRRELTHKRQ